jgi:hypothetical protein
MPRGAKKSKPEPVDEEALISAAIRQSKQEQVALENARREEERRKAEAHRAACELVIATGGSEEDIPSGNAMDRPRVGDLRPVPDSFDRAFESAAGRSARRGATRHKHTKRGAPNVSRSQIAKLLGGK